MVREKPKGRGETGQEREEKTQGKVVLLCFLLQKKVMFGRDEMSGGHEGSGSALGGPPTFRVAIFKVNRDTFGGEGNRLKILLFYLPVYLFVLRPCSAGALGPEKSS